MLLYVVFDGFSHGMFDVRLTASLSLTALALLVAVLLVAAEAIVDRRIPFGPPWTLAAVLVAFIAYLYYSTWWSGGIYDLALLKNLLLFLLICSLCKDERDLAWVFGAAAAAGLFQTALGLVQISQVGGLPKDGVAGVLPNHVQYAMYLALSAIAMFPFVASRRGWNRVPAAAGLAVMVTMALLSVARGVLVAGAVVAVAAVFLLVRERKWILAWLGGLFAGGFALTLVSGRLGTLLDLPFALGDVQRLDLLMNHRLPLLWAAWNMFTERPVLGVGYGSFPKVWAQYVPADFGNVWMKELELATHSTYLQIMAETGLVGIALYVAILFFGMRYSIGASRVFDSEKRTFVFYASVAAFLGILAIATHGILDNTGWHDRVFYIYLGLAAALQVMAFSKKAEQAL